MEDETAAGCSTRMEAVVRIWGLGRKVTQKEEGTPERTAVRQPAVGAYGFRGFGQVLRLFFLSRRFLEVLCSIEVLFEGG